MIRDWMNPGSPVIALSFSIKGDLEICVYEIVTVMNAHLASFMCAPDGFIFKNRWGARGEVAPSDLPTAMVLKACLDHYWSTVRVKAKDVIVKGRLTCPSTWW